MIPTERHDRDLQSPFCMLLAILLPLTASALAAAGAKKDKNGPAKKAQSGKTVLVYQVEVPKMPHPARAVLTDKMKQLVTVLNRRIKSTGIRGAARAVEMNRIEVTLFTTDPKTVSRLRSLIPRPGTLEFAIVANTRDHLAIIAKALTATQQLRNDGNVIAAWRLPALGNDGKEVPIGNFGSVFQRKSKTRKGRTEFLVVYGPPKSRVTGRYLKAAYETRDENLRPAIGFEFNKEGAKLFNDLTGQNLPAKDGFRRRIAILVDDEMHSAPSIETRIGGRGIIHGRFSIAQVRETVNLLTAGSLPFPIASKPVSESILPAKSN